MGAHAGFAVQSGSEDWKCQHLQGRHMLQGGQLLVHCCSASLLRLPGGQQPGAQHADVRDGGLCSAALRCQVRLTPDRIQQCNYNACWDAQACSNLLWFNQGQRVRSSRTRWHMTAKRGTFLRAAWRAWHLQNGQAPVLGNQRLFSGRQRCRSCLAIGGDAGARCLGRCAPRAVQQLRGLRLHGRNGLPRGFRLLAQLHTSTI